MWCTQRSIVAYSMQLPSYKCYIDVHTSTTMDPRLPLEHASGSSQLSSRFGSGVIIYFKTLSSELSAGRDDEEVVALCICGGFQSLGPDKS